MAVFNYYAKNHEGMRFTGILEAEVIQEAIRILHQKDLIVISVKEERLRKAAQSPIKLDDLVVFSRQLATMVEAGITLVHALNVMSEQSENKTLALAVIGIREDIVAGSTLHQAMSKYPKIFKTMYVNMVKAGETSGFLDEILDRLAGYLEKQAALERKIKAAMVYPILVISMALAITIGLLIKVVPTFKNIFETLGGTLPLPTQILLLISDIVRKGFPFVIGAVMLLCFAFRKYVSTPKGRYNVDSKMLKVAIFGPLIRKVVVAKFARTLSVLIKSAVPILNALEIVANSAANTVVQKTIMDTREAIRHGEPIAEPLSRNGVFPPLVVRMINVGEQTGQLEKMLSKVADLYEDQVDAAISGLTSMIEPLIIGFLGIVIGGIVIALFMPIFKITELIR
jgi:type IV pilus assembly protein PilC